MRFLRWCPFLGLGSFCNFESLKGKAMNGILRDWVRFAFLQIVAAPTGLGSSNLLPGPLMKAHENEIRRLKTKDLLGSF